MSTLQLPDEAATRRLGRAIATVVVPGDVVLLEGSLGAGKTTLTKGLVAALGGTRTVTSPTFTLCHLYDTSPVVCHVDCWRLGELSEVIDLALEEILDDGGVIVAEWGEVAAAVIGEDALVVALVPDREAGRDERVASLAASGDSWEKRLPALERCCGHEGLEVRSAALAQPAREARSR